MENKYLVIKLEGIELKIDKEALPHLEKAYQTEEQKDYLKNTLTKNLYEIRGKLAVPPEYMSLIEEIEIEALIKKSNLIKKLMEEETPNKELIN